MNSHVLKAYISRGKMKLEALNWVFMCQETLRLFETL